MCSWTGARFAMWIRTKLGRVFVLLLPWIVILAETGAGSTPHTEPAAARITVQERSHTSSGPCFVLIHITTLLLRCHDYSTGQAPHDFASQWDLAPASVRTGKEPHKSRTKFRPDPHRKPCSCCFQDHIPTKALDHVT